MTEYNYILSDRPDMVSVPSQDKLGELYVYPIYGKTKMVAMAKSVSCRVSATSAFCRLTTQIPSITTQNQLAILVPKLIAMTTTLRLLNLSYVFI